ncbi:MAG: hypothetical protein ACPL5I_17070, partial [Thermodesulfobacteriota bacterium]
PPACLLLVRKIKTDRRSVLISDRPSVSKLIIGSGGREERTDRFSNPGSIPNLKLIARPVLI